MSKRVRRARSRSQSVSSDEGQESIRGVTVMEVDTKDAGLILGKNFKTKKKFEAAANVHLKMIHGENDRSQVEISGRARNREVAEQYIGFLLALKRQETLEFIEDRDDITEVLIPSKIVGYITGKDRATLGNIEEATGTIIFFAGTVKAHTADVASSTTPTEQGGDAAANGDYSGLARERLVILSTSLRNRSAALFKVMSAVEGKMPGLFVDGSEAAAFERRGEEFGVRVVSMTSDEFSAALGRRGAQRHRLEAASGAIVEYVGLRAFIGGSRQERNRARDYLRMLLEQREGAVRVDEGAGEREDVEVLRVPADFAAALSANHCRELRELEEGLDVLCFVDDRGRLLIFGKSRRARQIAVDAVHRRLASAKTVSPPRQQAWHPQQQQQQQQHDHHQHEHHQQQHQEKQTSKWESGGSKSFGDRGHQTNNNSGGYNNNNNNSAGYNSNSHRSGGYSGSNRYNYGGSSSGPVKKKSLYDNE